MIIPERPCGHRWDISKAEAAPLLASLGYSVLPLEPGAKRPHRMLGDRGGVHWATTQPAQLAWWWSQDPAANIGVATGEPNQLVVIDLDNKRADGVAEFRRFCEQYGLAVPWNALVRTPSGGWHCWLRWPPGYGPCPERRGILPAGDVKGSGGYVVAAPSALLFSDKAGDYPVQYGWHGWSCPCAAPLAPGWMADWLKHAPAAGSAGGGLGGGGDIDAEKIMAEGAPAGLRNDTLYKLACSRYRKHGTDSALVLAELRQAWAAGETAGMPWREVLTLAESARKFVAAREAAEALATAQFAAWLSREGAR
jgi:hypothetical protein